jgi:hypothetical protein
MPSYCQEHPTSCANVEKGKSLEVMANHCQQCQTAERMIDDTLMTQYLLN